MHCERIWRLSLAPDRHPDAAVWIRARAPQWQALAAETAAAPRRTLATVDDALGTLRTYRILARHLASARSLLPGSYLATALENACAALHVAIGRPPRFGRTRLLTLLRDEIPTAAGS